MPRIRSLKPEIASDVKLAKCSRDARYTFVLMITQSDDIGLLGGAHRQLLGTLYPLDDDVTVAMLLGWLEELVNVGLVRWRETRDGVPVLQLVNWAKHQRVDNAGRSQLGALLAESPADLNSTPAEDRGDSPRVAEDRGLDHRPPTKDQGPRTTDHQVQEAATRFAVRANQGLTEHEKPSRRQLVPRIIASADSTSDAARKILEAGVPLAFAESTIYELARTHNANGQVKSLKYFVSAVIRAHEEHVALEQAQTTPRPEKRNGKRAKGSTSRYHGRISED